MGRSVSVLSNADEVTYFDVSGFGYTAPYNEEIGDYDENAEKVYDDWQGIEDWNDFKENLFAAIEKRCQSVHSADRWEHREDHIFAENGLVEFGISEYCGLASVSVRVHRDLDNWGENKAGLAENWIARVWPNLLRDFERAVGKPLRRIGTFSNGESVYSR